MTLVLCGFSVQGTVRASGSGEPIAYAVIEAVEGTARSESDSAGHYQALCLSRNTHAIRISRLGFTPRTVEIAGADGDTLRLDVELAAQPLVLPPIEVAGPLRGEPGGAGGGDQDPLNPTFSTGDLAASPLVGALDPLASLPVPDALTAGDPLPGLRVRGASSGQSVTLLDGVPIFNPYHAGGAGALSPYVVSRVTLYDDAPPAQWGGGVASVVAMDTRASGVGPTRWDGSVDPLWVSQFVTTRILGGTGDILAGGRIRNVLVGSPDNGNAAAGSDGFARITAPALGGRMELLFFGTADRVGFDTTVADLAASGPGSGESATDRALGSAPTNGFKWASLTEALRWTGRVGPAGVDVRGWRTSYSANVNWLTPAPVAATSSLRNVGLALAVSGSPLATHLDAGVDVQRFGTSYAAQDAGPNPGPTLGYQTAPVILGAFLEDCWRSADARWTVAAGVRSDRTPWGAMELAPRVTLGVAPTPALALRATYGRTSQFVQSVANDESLIGAVSGIALPVAADGKAVPVASADQATASVILRPRTGATVTVETYRREMSGLLLVAPVSAMPFATTGYAVGSGQASGVVVSFERRTPRVTVQAIYAAGSTHLDAAGVSYAPAAAPSQALAAGLALRGPRGTTFRVAAWGSVGRRTSVIGDSVVWTPAGQLGGVGDLDGSPLSIRGPLDGAALPAYLRLDVGVRREWSSVFGRAEDVTGVVTVTNLLGRSNVVGLWQPVTASTARALALTGRALSVELEWHLR